MLYAIAMGQIITQSELHTSLVIDVLPKPLSIDTQHQQIVIFSMGFKYFYNQRIDQLTVA